MWITLLLSLLAFVGVVQDEPAGDVDTLLDKMRLAGEELRTLESRVEFEDFDFNMGDNPIRPGHVWLRKAGADGKDVTFRVLLHGKRDGPDGAYKPEKIEYRLRGDELVDRNYLARNQVTRKLSPEQADRDLLKLGEGPFPLPIGQPVAEVRRQFVVTRYDPAEPDDLDLEVAPVAGTVRLRLMPREGTPLADDFSQVELDVEPTSGLPLQVITLDAGGTNLRIVRLYDPTLNGEVDSAKFELEDIDLAGWNVAEE